MRLPALLALLAVILSGCASGVRSSPDTGARTTVILVRHAEKSGAGTDPGLTEAGRAWAGELSHWAVARGVTAVVSTPYRRTLETATPAALAAGVGLTIVPAEGGDEGVALYAERVARLIASGPEGGVWLVVGHSNTIPALIARLGGPGVSIDENAYGELFILDLVGDGRATMERRMLEVAGFTLPEPGGDGV